MTHQNHSITGLEQLEQRVLLSADPILSALFDSAQTVDISPVDTITINGDLDVENATQAYEISTPAQGTFYIDVSALTGDLDSMLEIYNDQGRRVGFNDNANRDTTDSSLKLRISPDQTLYMLVSAKGGTGGSFELNLESDPKDDIANTFDQAGRLRVSRRGTARGRGTINYSGDVDMLSLVATQSGNMTVDLSQAGRLNQLDPIVSVYDVNGELIVQDDNSGGGVNSQVTFEVVAGQTYYLMAGDAGTTTGRFQVSVKMDDIGNTFDEAGALGVSRRGTTRSRGEIGYAGDVDMLSIVATKTGEMTVKVSQSGRNNELDPIVSVYDSNGELIAEDDNGGDGVNAMVTFDVVAGETYYLKLGDSGSVETGRYNVTVTIQEIVPPPAPEPEPEPAPAPEPEPEPEVEPAPEPDEEPAPETDYSPGGSVVADIIQDGEAMTLRILGTDGDDDITVSRLGSDFVVETGDGSWTFSGSIDSILIYGFDGADTITLTNDVTVGSSVYGGAGDDTIYAAGMGADLLFGDAGDDLLVSIGGASDVVSGGAGFDSFWADSADSITDASTAETVANAVHVISEFYQPYTTNSSSSDYVSLQIAGQDLVDPEATSYASGWANFSDTPLFVDGPQYDDIEQGAVGDCYYLAALASLADTDPQVIEQMVTSLGDGTYAVRFFRYGVEYTLRIDGDLPVYSSGSLVYADTGVDGELWVPIAEKAYAHFRYGQNSYASINGGWMSTVYREITGGWTNTKYTSSNTTELYNYLQSNLSQGYSISLGSNYSASGPVVGGHAYMVQSVETVNGQMTVTIYNTWGWDGRTWDSNSGDGLLTLSIGLISDNFMAAVTSMV